MGGTYNEMQECLRNVFAQLGDECQLYTRAAEACDFEVIRTVCPVHEADSATGTAACLHRISEDYYRGRAKTVPKAFFNFSHDGCIEVLEALPRGSGSRPEDQATASTLVLDGASPGAGPANTNGQVQARYSAASFVERRQAESELLSGGRTYNDAGGEEENEDESPDDGTAAKKRAEAAIKAAKDAWMKHISRGGEL